MVRERWKAYKDAYLERQTAVRQQNEAYDATTWEYPAEYVPHVLHTVSGLSPQSNKATIRVGYRVDGVGGVGAF
jgi:DNA polymerase IIIc chi subunit